MQKLNLRIYAVISCILVLGGYAGGMVNNNISNGCFYSRGMEVDVMVPSQFSFNSKSPGDQKYRSNEAVLFSQNSEDTSSVDYGLKLREGFSPNGDGINDRYVIPWLNRFDSVNFRVFNRWGTIVYQKDNYQNEWDGNANSGAGIGEKLPVGTYYYLITINDTGQKLKGYIFLKR